MCEGRWIHHAEIETYLRGTRVLRKVARGSSGARARAREADALVALWKILVERLEGDEHARWCALLRGPVAAMDDAIVAALRLRFLDEVRRTDGVRKKKVEADELAGVGNEERFSAAFWARAAGGPEVEMEAEERRGWLRSAVEGLPEKERAAVTAYDLEEETFAGVAARLGVPESTVRGWREAGIRRLRAAAMG